MLCPSMKHLVHVAVVLAMVVDIASAKPQVQELEGHLGRTEGGRFVELITSA